MEDMVGIGEKMATATRKKHTSEDDLGIDEAHTENWIVLAEHVQAKVLKRSSDVSYLHTKAGFLIAACVVAIQVLGTFGKFSNQLAIVGSAVAVVLVISSLVFAIVSMTISKSATPLNIDDMILTMHKGKLSRVVFTQWLIDSYNLANKEFNKTYSKKYDLQLLSAYLLVMAIVIIVILKGYQLYV